MDFRYKGVQTQLKNIEAHAGQTLAQLRSAVADLGALKHGEKRRALQDRFGLSFVHADTLLLWVDSETTQIDDTDPLDAIYVGPKAALRPIHDAFIARVAELGPFEMVPKKGYVSLRQSKQFCMIGPATNTRVDIGINAKGIEPTERLRQLPAGKLCPLEVRLTRSDEVDNELIGWISTAWAQSIGRVTP